MRNIVCGSIVSGRLFPLIFDTHDTSGGDDEPARLRSLDFFRVVVAAPEQYRALDEAQKRHVAVGVRDLFFARARGYLDATERELLDRMIALIDDVPYGHLNGDSMSFSCCPTRAEAGAETETETAGKEWTPLVEDDGAEATTAPRR